MLQLYSVFHCNLAFSMIPREHFPLVIERCYTPILDIAERGVPVGIEMSAWTLREVNNIAPAFVERLKRLCDEGNCEFIGSGYSQAIFPLIPADVNRWNLQAGMRHYIELLGRAPVVALVNEQTYSRGMADLYAEAGYTTIIMDWNNCFQHNRYPKDYLYSPQRAVGAKGSVNVLWSNSIAFQKFQRCIHGEAPEAEYLEYLFSHYRQGADRAFMLYTNDAEVFDYRPGQGSVVEGEYAKVERLLKKIMNDAMASVKTPSAVAARFKGKAGAFNPVALESVETPVVCKKQEKYNPVRWAVAGRDSVHINTECHKAYRNILKLERTQAATVGELLVFKEILSDIWGSDYRSNTIDEKFLYFHNRLGWLKVETDRLVALAGSNDAPVVVDAAENTARAARPASVTSTDGVTRVRTDTVILEFIDGKGLALKSAVFPGVSASPLIGTLQHGHYEDMHFGADFFSGHFIHTAKDGKKATDLRKAAQIVGEDAGSVSIGIENQMEIGAIWKTYVVSKTAPSFSVTYRLKVNGLVASSLRLGIFTFMPSALDKESLWFETVNGGDYPEKFFLKGHGVRHDEPVSQSVSASGCLGATEGWVTIGDKDKHVRIFTDKCKLYSVPMLNYTELADEETFFLRLYHTIGEFDDTAWWVWRGYNEITFTVTAGRN